METLIPPGPYVLEVVEVDNRGRTKTGNMAYMIKLRIVKTQRPIIYWWVTNSVAGSFIWEEIVDKFEDMPTVIGRAFLFNVYHERQVEIGVGPTNQFRNRVREPLAELVSMKEFMPGRNPFVNSRI
jgi:hypothetical protein